MRLRRIELERLTAGERNALLRRGAVPDKAVRDGAMAVCDDVAERGDEALAEYAERFGGGFRRVGRDEMLAAVEEVGPEVIDALEAAAANVEAYHRAQLPTDLVVTTVPGWRSPVGGRRCDGLAPTFRAGRPPIRRR
jgi:histidinol dehydrogenase